MQTHISPRLAQHIISVYERMEAESVKVEGNQLYIGSLSILVRSIASSTYYSDITRALYDGGYAALLDRGGRSKPSTLVLLRKPKEDELMALTMEAEAPIMSVMNRLAVLETSVGGMNVVKALSDVDRRLQLVERTGVEHSGRKA
jgi:hypothetical protein